MSDVVVSVVESNTNVTVSEQDVAVDVTENVVQVSVSTAGLQGVPGANNDPVYVTVRNATGALLPKGSIVYVSGGNGTHTQVSLAQASGDATSARTLGWLAADIANNADGLCMVEGYLDGVNTQGVTEGVQLYLSGTTPGGFQVNKPVAPIHLVYVGVCVKASAGNGRVYVKVQNGYELDEIHDVLIVAPQNNQVLVYDSATQLWKNATNAPDGVTSITATAPLTGGTITSTGSIGLDQTALSITKSQVSDFTSGTVTSASTAQQAGTAVYSVNSGTAVYATTSGTATYSTNSGTAVYATTSGTAVTITGDITKSQVSDFTSGTVASAGTAQQAGTAVYAVNAGTSVYATNSGTAVFADNSGTATFATNAGTAVFATNASTAVTISGSITQSQVTNLTTDLAAKVNLAGGNSLTGTQTVTIPGTAGTNVLALKSTVSTVSNLLNVRFESANGNLFDMGKNETANQSGSFYLYTGQALPIELYNSATKRLIIESTGNVNIGPTTGAGTARLSVFVDTATRVGQLIRGAASQSADLLQIQNSASTVLARVDAFGQLLGTSALFGPNSATNSVAITVRPVANQIADLVQYQNSASAIQGGRNGVGQIFTGSTTPILAASGGTIQSIATGANPLVTMASAHGFTTGDLITLAGTTGNTYNGTFVVASTPASTTFTITTALTAGQAGAAGTASDPAQLSVTARSAGTIGAIIRGASGQSASLQQWQNNSGGLVATMSAAGDLAIFGNGITSGDHRVGTATYLNAALNVQARAATEIGTVIRGAASQSVDLLQLQNSAGVNQFRVDQGGMVVTNALGVAGSPSGISYSYFTTPVANAVPVVVRGHASQTSDLSQWQLGDGSLRTFITANGRLAVRTGVLGDGVANLYVGAVNTTDKGIVVRGAVSQSANLQEWQSDTGSIIGRVASSGDIFGNRVRTLNSAFRGQEANGGGQVQLERNTSLPTNPGANNALIYFRDGTNAGTLKLVVRAGAAGAETTILDNIPQ